LTFTADEVRYVAGLANLKLSAEEEQRMARDLGQILTHIEQLNEIDTREVAPMAQVLFAEDETAALRQDVPHTSLSNHDALANAPLSGSGYFKVPKVIER
jgi:aspartyl-tRNA(Asn)/glutamyl-tRNA(Gln) amidotransferase subunit C